MSAPGRDVLWALVVAAVGLALLTLVTPAAPLTGDGQHYVEFAASGLQHGAASTWHARRVLGVAIVAALPMDTVAAFRLLTLTSLVAAALCLWGAARGLGARGAQALVAIPLFYGTWAVAPNLREYALVDPLAWAWVAGIWLATVYQRWRWAALLGVLGAVTRETTLIAVLAAGAAAWVSVPGEGPTPTPNPLPDSRSGLALPLPLAGGWRCEAARPATRQRSVHAPASGSRAGRAIGVAGPAVLTVILLTVLIPGSGAEMGNYLRSWLSTGLGSLGPARALYLVFASLGALWLLVPRGVLREPRHLRAASGVFLLAAILLPFVGSPERMEEAIAPAVVTAAVLATCDRPGWWAWTLAIANLLFVARVGGDAPIPQWLAWPAELIALGLAVATYLPRYRSVERTASDPDAAAHDWGGLRPGGGLRFRL
jgi:hypothetical protein